jgi:predicted ATPase
MVNYYALEEQLKQRADALLREAAASRMVAKARRPARPEADQIERPAEAQYGARILRLSSFPAWSRGSSGTKSTERGRL